MPKRLVEAPLPPEVLRGRGCLAPFDFKFDSHFSSHFRWRRSLMSLCGTKVASMSNVVTDCVCQACLVQLDEGLAAGLLVVDEQKVLRWK